MKGKYLITTTSWFIAPDGREYKSAWGEIEITEDTFLGIKTNRNSVNWFAKVGSDEKHVIIAGCQINYAVKCDKRPHDGPAENWTADASNGIIKYESPCKIYFAQ